MIARVNQTVEKRVNFNSTQIYYGATFFEGLKVSTNSDMYHFFMCAIFCMSNASEILERGRVGKRCGGGVLADMPDNTPLRPPQGFLYTIIHQSKNVCLALGKP